MNQYLRFVVYQLWQVRGYVAAAAALFVLGIAAGPLYPEPGQRMAQPLADMARELEGGGFFEIAFAIFSRNLMSVSVALLLGAGLGILPATSALMNGWLAGAMIADRPGMVWLLIPHGIFELPAVFIAWGLGIWCGFWVFAHPAFATLKFRLMVSLWLLVMLVVPLLLIAAVVEAGLIVWMAG